MCVSAGFYRLFIYMFFPMSHCVHISQHVIAIFFSLVCTPTTPLFLVLNVYNGFVLSDTGRVFDLGV